MVKKKSFMVFIMYDITRGGIVLNSHKIKMKKGKNKVHVNIPIDILNNVVIRWLPQYIRKKCQAMKV